MSDSKPFTIAIVGGGLAGLTLSIGLARHGISHRIYESAKQFSEIGAGIAMGPNAISALTLIDPLIKEAYNRTATFNEDPQFRYHWMLCRYGMEAEEGGEAKCGDLIKTVGATSLLDKGRSSCHRAKFLDELIGIRPRDIAEFNKTMVHIDENEDGVLTSFADGTTAHASAVVCCDGIKSVARSLVLGSDHPAVKPVFS
ncbi:hypothetical protein LTS18_006728, partial [Coniosporium uncinatum]